MSSALTCLPANEAQAVPSQPVPIAPKLPTPDERLAQGKARRKEVCRAAHAGWRPAVNRADPIALLEESSHSRLPRLVPIRYGRMLESPFAFLRGSPIIMANDLAGTPVSGITVQIGGDVHLMNFGLYASPERRLLFDLNDFDETLPGPWEWDLKRLAASCVVAGRCHDMGERAAVEAALACGRAYRERMLEYSTMPLLDVYYSRVSEQAALTVFHGDGRKAMARAFTKGQRRDRLRDLSKLAKPGRSGTLHIKNDPPRVTHVKDDMQGLALRRFLSGYYNTLQDDRRAFIERDRFVDLRLKVVGVGSVGTRCYIVLFDGSHSGDPMFLQVKEAQASVLERHLGPSRYHNHGRRVVNGQRRMQSASDVFLGWSSEGGRDYYVRQLRDMKASANLDKMSGVDMIGYARLCGWVLARAHARSGDAAQIAGYLGKCDAFDEALVAFAKAYADQTERDYKVFKAAVKSGRLKAKKGI